MKKIGLFFLCFLLFAAVVGGGFAYMYLTPRGILRPDGPDRVMQSLMDDMDRESWRNEYVRLSAPPVSEFEDAGQVAGDIYDAAVTGEVFSFRPVSGSESSVGQDYIVCCGDADLLLARAAYDQGHWSVRFEGLDTLHAEPRSLTVTVPEGTSLALNGKAVDESYIVDDGVLYPDMSALEMRFDSWPHLVRYRIDGIYEKVDLEARRDGGVTLLYDDGSTWSYTVPDAAGYAFSVMAPGEARVSGNGAELDTGDVSAVSAYVTKLDIPGELQGALPSYSIYAAGGLYTPPKDFQAVMPDGTALAGETLGDGSVTFPLPGSQVLYDTHHARVEEFMKALCEYGAGHTARYYPGAYVAAGSGFQRYLQNAVSSLYWTVGVATSYGEISSGDYIPLGDGAFLCRGHVDCTTVTRFQTVDLHMNYEMLWVDSNGTWLLQDLAFI